MARNSDIRRRLKKMLSDDVGSVDERLDARPRDSSYPIYILDLGLPEYRIVFPADKKDITHCDFWLRVVSRVVAKELRLPWKGLKNLPYCQRRARIAGKKVYYGEDERPSSLLRLIERAVGEKGLKFVYEEHETRLEYDVADFAALSLG